MKRIKALLIGDLKNITRDSLLVYIPFGSIIMALLIRFITIYLNKFLIQNYQFSLEPYYPLLMSFIVLSIPSFFGMIIGFLLLDERDEQILNFIAVTPLSKSRFLLYRTGLPVAINIVFTIIGLMVAGLTKTNYLSILPVIIMASLEAPMVALFLGTFAANKIEGLALAKATGILYFAPLVILFIPMPWQLLAGFIPTYWISKAYLEIGRNHQIYWFSILAGLFIHLVIIRFLLHKFRQKTD